MMCLLPNITREEAIGLLRFAGYLDHVDEHGTHGFHKRIHDGRFPRFHASVGMIDGHAKLNVHLDQMNNGRIGNHRYVWSYANPLVRAEIARLESCAEDWFRAGMPIPQAMQPRKPRRTIFTLFSSVRRRVSRLRSPQKPV